MVSLLWNSSTVLGDSSTEHEVNASSSDKGSEDAEAKLQKARATIVQAHPSIGALGKILQGLNSGVKGDKLTKLVNKTEGLDDSQKSAINQALKDVDPQQLVGVLGGAIYELDPTKGQTAQNTSKTESAGAPTDSSKNAKNGASDPNAKGAQNAQSGQEKNAQNAQDKTAQDPLKAITEFLKNQQAQQNQQGDRNREAQLALAKEALDLKNQRGGQGLPERRGGADAGAGDANKNPPPQPQQTAQNDDSDRRQHARDLLDRLKDKDKKDKEKPSSGEGDRSVTVNTGKENSAKDEEKKSKKETEDRLSQLAKLDPPSTAEADKKAKKQKRKEAADAEEEAAKAKAEAAAAAAAAKEEPASPPLPVKPLTNRLASGPKSALSPINKGGFGFDGGASKNGGGAGADATAGAGAYAGGKGGGGGMGMPTVKGGGGGGGGGGDINLSAMRLDAENAGGYMGGGGVIFNKGGASVPDSSSASTGGGNEPSGSAPDAEESNRSKTVLAFGGGGIRPPTDTDETKNTLVEKLKQQSPILLIGTLVSDVCNLAPDGSAPEVCAHFSAPKSTKGSGNTLFEGKIF